jgi:hypothetical protein
MPLIFPGHFLIPRIMGRYPLGSRLCRLPCGSVRRLGYSMDAKENTSFPTRKYLSELFKEYQDFFESEEDFRHTVRSGPSARNVVAAGRFAVRFVGGSMIFFLLPMSTSGAKWTKRRAVFPNRRPPCESLIFLATAAVPVAVHTQQSCRNKATLRFFR